MLGYALYYIEKVHKGQTRKYTGEPYSSHPIAVAKEVHLELSSQGADPKLIELASVVALLHDVVEDTSATIEDIRANFSDEVAKGVWFLTDPENFVGNRKTRKALTKARLALAPDYVKLIKRKDIEHNASSIAVYDPDFYKVFKKETDSLLEVL